MQDEALSEIVDMLSNPYLFGLPSEGQVPVSVRRRGELFSQALISLRKLNYPITHKDGRGNEYFSARAFAAFSSTGKPLFGTVVFSGKGYDVFIYDEDSMKLQLAKKGVKVAGKAASSARKSLYSMLRNLEQFHNSDIFSVRVLVCAGEMAKRDSQLLSDGDIEADAYDQTG